MDPLWCHFAANAIASIIRVPCIFQPVSEMCVTAGTERYLPSLTVGESKADEAVDAGGVGGRVGEGQALGSVLGVGSVTTALTVVNEPTRASLAISATTVRFGSSSRMSMAKVAR